MPLVLLLALAVAGAADRQGGAAKKRKPEVMGGSYAGLQFYFFVLMG